MRQTFHTMGTVASLDIPGCDDQSVFRAAFERLRQVDERFSLYKHDSEASRYARGELAAKDVSAEFRRVKNACAKFERQTNGFFTPNFGDGYDPTGYVKGWSIVEAAKVVRSAGYGTFCIGIGGDILAASDSDKVWGIGIQDPRERSQIIKILELKNGAVATSGTYERGAHIINPKTGRPATYWVSTTVTGPDIITADVLATACYAAGSHAKAIMANFPAYELLAVK